MGKTRSILAVDSVLVRLRPNAYHRIKSTGRTYHGARNQPGSPKYREASAPFRVSRVRWERDEGLPPGLRIFTRVGEDEPIKS